MPERGAMGVVGVKGHRNFLRHLTAADGRPAWETRSVRTYCGQVLLATGYHEPNENTGARDRYGFPLLRHECSRCLAIARRGRVSSPSAVQPPNDASSSRALGAKSSQETEWPG